MLGAHSAVATTTEPWLLLPFLYATRRRGIFTEYGKQSQVTALEDFSTHFPEGIEDYYKEIAETVRRLYQKAVHGDEIYFLDKTPRYHLVVHEIINLFPEARFIFLWRNPLAVAASIIETWGGGRWNLHRFNIDLYDGLAGLIDAYSELDGRSLGVRYEDLITEPVQQLGRILEFLELQSDVTLSDKFSQTSLSGRLGDPTGVRDYQKLVTEPLVKWLGTLSNPLRVRWAKRYLEWIGDDRLDVMGYSSDELMALLLDGPRNGGYLVSDVIQQFGALFYLLMEPHIMKQKLRDLRDGRRLIALR